MIQLEAGAHDAGKRLWIGLAHATIRCLNAHDPLVTALRDYRDAYVSRNDSGVIAAHQEFDRLLALLEDPARDRGFAKPQT